MAGTADFFLRSGSATRHRIARMIVYNDHLVDLTEDVVRQALPKLDKQGWYKRRRLLEPWKTDKVLVVRILRDLIYKLAI